MQKRLAASDKPSLHRSILYGIALGVGLGIVFALGFFTRDIVAGLSPALATVGTGGEYVLLSEVQVLLDQRYLREQPEKVTREYGAIRGMLLTLNDPYTFFIDPPVAATESQTLAGTYGGIGVQLQRAADGSWVLYPFADSPAARAGIENGDVLRALNGSPIDIALGQDVIDQQLRGEVRAGNGIEITVTKANDDSTLTVFIEFAVINVPSAVWRILNEYPAIGYLHIMRFTSRTPDEVRTAIAELQASGAQRLILDLRDNSGGLLDESIAVADEFLDSGVIVYERNHQSEETFNATEGGAGVGLPLLVLVNERTASGAELVAGAIQDNDVAALIGQRTFGKGTVQQIYSLSDGSSLHVTSAEWLTPDRQALNQNGLQPDITVMPDPNGRDVILEEAIRAFESS
jgi:carboxyl-terminal processing protease